MNKSLKVKIYTERFDGLTGGHAREKLNVLNTFADGVRRFGDEITTKDDFDVLFTITSHLPETMLGRPVLFYDRDLFSLSNRNYFIRIGFKADNDPKSIKTQLRAGMCTKERFEVFLPWILPNYKKIHENKGNEILLLPNATKGIGKNSVDPLIWVQDTIATLMKISKRPITLRPHPRDGYFIKKFLAVPSPLTNIKIDDQVRIPIEYSLRDTFAGVIYNSTAAMALFLAGIPIFSTFPQSILAPICNHDLSEIDRPKYLTENERLGFLMHLAHSHWTLDEIRLGEVWKIYRKELLS